MTEVNGCHDVVSVVVADDVVNVVVADDVTLLMTFLAVVPVPEDGQARLADWTGERQPH